MPEPPATEGRPDLHPLIRAWIAQLCSAEFLAWMERCDAFEAQVDVTLHGTRGRPIENHPPTITLHRR